MSDEEIETQQLSQVSPPEMWFPEFDCNGFHTDSEAQMLINDAFAQATARQMSSQSSSSSRKRKLERQNNISKEEKELYFEPTPVARNENVPQHDTLHFDQSSPKSLDVIVPTRRSIDMRMNCSQLQESVAERTLFNLFNSFRLPMILPVSEPSHSFSDAISKLSSALRTSVVPEPQVLPTQPIQQSSYQPPISPSMYHNHLSSPLNSQLPDYPDYQFQSPYPPTYNYQSSTSYRSTPTYQSSTYQPTEREKCATDLLATSFLDPSGTNRNSKAGHRKKKIFTCSFAGCNKEFTAKFSLNRHVRNHSGEKPFVCHYPDCDRKFSEKSGLKRHFQKHTGEKPWKCPFCWKVFADKVNLKRHFGIDHKNLFHLYNPSGSVQSNLT